jgi:hypothetical protein
VCERGRTPLSLYSAAKLPWPGYPAACVGAKAFHLGMGGGILPRYIYLKNPVKYVPEGDLYGKDPG